MVETLDHYVVHQHDGLKFLPSQSIDSAIQLGSCVHEKADDDLAKGDLDSACAEQKQPLSHKAVGNWEFKLTTPVEDGTWIIEDEFTAEEIARFGANYEARVIASRKAYLEPGVRILEAYAATLKMKKKRKGLRRLKDVIEEKYMNLYCRYNSPRVVDETVYTPLPP